MSHSYALENVEVALSPQERFEEFLRSRGKRNTPQRRLILDQVFARHAHFDADDLLAHLRESGVAGKVSRASLYRTLKQFVDAGLLRQMTLGGRAIYEHDYGYPQHEHLVCEKCEKKIEFQSPAIESMIREVAQQQHFQPSGHTFIIRGICRDCNQAKMTKRRLDLI